MEKLKKEIQTIKTNKNISYFEARKLIAPAVLPNLRQVAKPSIATSTTQTDENITKVKCPPLQILKPLVSVLIQMHLLQLLQIPHRRLPLRTSNSPRKLCNHGGTLPANKPKRSKRRAWGIFRRYPTSANLIAFKRAKALARRIRRQCQRESGSSMCLQSHRQTNYQSITVMEKGFTIRDDLQISCEGSTCLIERQLQTAVNNIVKWCDTNGHSISASKSCCVYFCRKRGIHPDPEIRIRDIQIPVVPDVRFLECCQTPLGADRTSLLRVYQAIVLSRIDYGCVAYGSACNSTLQKLDPVHHMALRICSGAFRTSPVQSLYVNCHQPPLDLRRRKLSLAFYFKILSVPSHPLQNVYMSTSMKRLYDARPSNFRPFMDRDEASYF
ncbi:RNase H domain-containing protein [Trichonephila clavipes]|nr:RNase H domain-containing protein [Trichonephila clavipes]